MMRRSGKVAVVTGALVLASAGTAYAYWTVLGAGTGTAATGNVADVTVVQASTITGMAPGDSAQTLSGNFNNPNAGPVYVSSVTVSIDSVVKAAGAPAGTCDATDYTLANTVMSVAAEVPAGNGQGAWSGATIKFNDKTTTNQNACKGATVNLAYTVS